MITKTSDYGLQSRADEIEQFHSTSVSQDLICSCKLMVNHSIYISVRAQQRTAITV